MNRKFHWTLSRYGNSIEHKSMKTGRTFCKTGAAAPRQRAAITALENAAVCRPPLRNLIQTCLLCAAMLQALTSGAQPVTQVAAGYEFSLFLKSDGSLWAMGSNLYGQLGDGAIFGNPDVNTNSPEQIVASNVTAIATGEFHSLFLKSDGSLWAMGNNEQGQLGKGFSYFNSIPEQIVASNVTAIATGEFHSLFLKSDGSLWAMGSGQWGQLGDGITYNFPFIGTDIPEQIVASNVTAIAAGGSHSLFLKSDGSLWAMGHNQWGALGDGIGSPYSNNSTNIPEQIVASNVTAIAAGQLHSLFLKSDGSLWAMGLNDWGQLGDGTTYYALNNSTNRPEQIVASNVTAIAAGYYHSLFLKSDGSLWAMGLNKWGELGDGFSDSYPNPSTNSPEQIVAGNVIAIAAGESHSLFIKSDGSLWAMGLNEQGGLGDGTYDNSYRPEQIVGPYNQIQTAGQLLDGTNMQLNFVGVANANYALDRASSLSPPNWIPQLTNAAGSFGALVFSNAPDAATNNFWRIRSVP
jgi:alpha-tubulin suppressor-like RCC1 family protein